MTPVTKELILLCGLPFSGKTTYAQTLTPNGFQLISRDAILGDILTDNDLMDRMRLASNKIHAPVSRVFDSLAKNALNDVITLEYVRRVTALIQNACEKDEGSRGVVVDGTHLQALSRSFVNVFPNAHRTVIVFNTDPKTCITRMEQTDVHGLRITLTPKKIENLWRMFEPPNTSEGFDEIQTIDQDV